MLRFAIPVVLLAGALAPAVTLASPITVDVVQVGGATQAARLAQKAALLASLGAYTVLEDFEDFTASRTTGYTTLATGAGSFSFQGNGGGSACVKPGGPSASACDALYVLDAATTPFSGRYNTTPGGSRWLDSNDTTKVVLDLEQAHLNRRLDNLFFFMTDVNDQGGRLKVYGYDGSASAFDVFGSTASGSAQANGALFFVRLSSPAGIARVEWVNTVTGDGWGIDDIGTVPEPSSIVLFAITLFGAAARLRRARR